MDMFIDISNQWKKHQIHVAGLTKKRWKILYADDDLYNRVTNFDKDLTNTMRLVESGTYKTGTSPFFDKLFSVLDDDQMSAFADRSHRLVEKFWDLFEHF
jgi:hypothetical protein